MQSLIACSRRSDSKRGAIVAAGANLVPRAFLLSAEKSPGKEAG